MQRRIAVHAGRIAVENAAHVRREVPLVAGVQHGLHVQQLEEDVARDAVGPLQRGLAAAGGQDAVLQRGEVVLGLGEAEPVAGVGRRRPSAPGRAGPRNCPGGSSRHSPRRAAAPRRPTRSRRARRPGAATGRPPGRGPSRRFFSSTFPGPPTTSRRTPRSRLYGRRRRATHGEIAAGRRRFDRRTAGRRPLTIVQQACSGRQVIAIRTQVTALTLMLPKQLDAVRKLRVIELLTIGSPASVSI